jgi:hypothetical protein
MDIKDLERAKKYFSKYLLYLDNGILNVDISGSSIIIIFNSLIKANLFSYESVQIGDSIIPVIKIVKESVDV